MAASTDPNTLLRELYRGIDGWEIPRADERRVERSHGSPTYGELMPTATMRLLAQLELEPHDQFVDLGAGVGKVVLLAAMRTRVGSALGVELSRSRVALASEVIERARAAQLEGSERVDVVEGDMLKIELPQATVVYTCSTAFSESFMERLRRRLAALPRLRKLASLQSFERPHPGFELTEIYKLDASWKRKTKVHVYERVWDA